MHERRYNAGVDRLRSPDRLKRMEVPRVTDLTLAGIHPASVLDIGTGSGLFAESFAARGLKVAGIDPNPEMVTAAASHVPEGIFVAGTMEAIPFPDRSFDLVFLGNVLHESDDVVKALRECRRVAVTRGAILEWPYLEEEIGPPIAHRLRVADIRTAAFQAGWLKIEEIPLSHLILMLLS
jgi:ubiquinone/menaquinone biosynthesis C-methylase UbiE